MFSSTFDVSELTTSSFLPKLVATESFDHSHRNDSWAVSRNIEDISMNDAVDACATDANSLLPSGLSLEGSASSSSSSSSSSLDVDAAVRFEVVRDVLLLEETSTTFAA